MSASPTKRCQARPKITSRRSMLSRRSASRSSSGNRGRVRMHFVEPEHILALREMLERFLADEAPPEAVAEWDRTNRVPLEFQEKFGALGLTAVTVPEEFGGM